MSQNRIVMPDGTRSVWVRESTIKDSDNKFMLIIGGGLYPKCEAERIMEELKVYFQTKPGASEADKLSALSTQFINGLIDRMA